MRWIALLVLLVIASAMHGGGGAADTAPGPTTTFENPGYGNYCGFGPRATGPELKGTVRVLPDAPMTTCPG